MADRWIVDLGESGGYFLKTADGAVVADGLTQSEARRLANEHNGDDEYPAICRCGREVRKLNAASDDAKCVGCGYTEELCRCQPIT